MSKTPGAAWLKAGFSALAMRRRRLVEALIDNHSQIGHQRRMPLTLDQLGFATRALVAGVDWSSLSESDARRLRNLGVDEGVAVETLHRAPFGDPLAVRIGRMRVALRRAAARAIQVETAGRKESAET